MKNKLKNYSLILLLISTIILFTANCSNMKLSYYRWKQNNEIAFAQKAYAENQDKIKILNEVIQKKELDKKNLIVESNKYHLCADTNRSLFNDVKYINCNEYKLTYKTPD